MWFQPSFSWKVPSSHLPALCSSCVTHAGTQRPKGGCLPRSEGGDIFPGSKAWAKQQEERTERRGDLGFAIPAWLPATVGPLKVTLLCVTQFPHPGGSCAQGQESRMSNQHCANSATHRSGAKIHKVPFQRHQHPQSPREK